MYLVQKYPCERLQTGDLEVTSYKGNGKPARQLAILWKKLPEWVQNVAIESTLEAASSQLDTSAY
jgi:hypothetical protein